MIVENLSTLKINKLSQTQYERELAAGRIDENALYLTPDVGSEETHDEIYIGDGEMPETATIQIIMDGSDEEQVLKDDLKEYIDEEIEDEKGNIVNLIIQELQGLPVFGVVDENKIITVTSQLSGGTYTLKYENADGTLEEVGTITIGGKVVIVNLLESALTPNDITTVFDGVGYKNGYYASAAEPYYNTDAAFFCSGLMPIPSDRTFYIKGCTINTSLSHTRFGAFGETGLLVNTAKYADWGGKVVVTELGTQYYSITLTDEFMSTQGTNGAIPYYFYFSASGTGENVIVSATPID